MRMNSKNIRQPKSLSVSRRSSNENLLFNEIAIKMAHNKFNYLLTSNKKEDRYDSSPDSIATEDDLSFDEIKKELPKKINKLKLGDLFQNKKVLKEINSPSIKDFDYENKKKHQKSKSQNILWQKLYEKILLKPKELSLEEINLRINSILNNYEPTKTTRDDQENPYDVRDIISREARKFIPKMLLQLTKFQEDVKKEKIVFLKNRDEKSKSNTSLKKVSTNEKSILNLKRKTSYRIKSNSNKFLGVNLRSATKRETNFIVNLNPISEMKDDNENSESRPMIHNKSFTKMNHPVSQFEKSSNDLNIKNLHSRFTSANSNQFQISQLLSVDSKLQLNNKQKQNEINTSASFNSTKNDEGNKNIQLIIPNFNNNNNNNSDALKKSFPLFNYYINSIIESNINYPKYLTHSEKKSLSDIIFLNLLSSKNIPMDDIENIKHDIKAFEKELNNFKKNFNGNNFNIREEFFNFYSLTEDLKQINKKNINPEKLDQSKNIIDRILKKINDLNLNND